MSRHGSFDSVKDFDVRGVRHANPVRGVDAAALDPKLGAEDPVPRVLPRQEDVVHVHHDERSGAFLALVLRGDA